MKIVELNSMLNGSTGTIMLNLSKYLLAKGHQVLVCVPKRRMNSKNVNMDIYKFGNSLATKSHSILSQRFGYDGRFSFFSTKELIARIKSGTTALFIYFINATFLLDSYTKHLGRNCLLAFL